MQRTFLLVDDDADDTALFCEALEEVDAAVSCLCAADGENALTQLNKRQVLPDIIFLDINMPVMDGWECLQKLKNNSRYKDIPVIMYSTSSNIRDIQKAASLGALCFFTKPDDYIKLREIIRTIVEYIKNDDLLSVGKVIS